jgi:hypothetical protein
MQCGHHCGHEWFKRLKCVVRGSKHDRGEYTGAQILLVLQVVVDRHEHLEDRFGQTQQRTILDTSSTHFRYCRDIMADEMLLQLARQALVK